MLAIIFLILVVYFGDRITRQFYRFISIPHRLASSFLIGSLFSTVIVYLGSLLFARLRQPMILGNVVFVLIFALVVYQLPRVPRDTYLNTPVTRPPGWELWDWVFGSALVLFTCWLMFSNLSFSEGKFLIGFKGWTDFGANISLLQSFVLGHNFPTQHPFFPGEPIRYHFLFWFQSANLSFLGLNPVWSINLLSVLGFLSLMTVIAALAEVLFNSRVVGRLAVLFFLFSSSLYYIPFLREQASLASAIDSITKRTEFLTSGYPWRGENWGVLTVSVLVNQRHLISGIALLFVVMIFLVDRYQQKESEKTALEVKRDYEASKNDSPANEVVDGEPASVTAAGSMIDRADATGDGSVTAPEIREATAENETVPMGVDIPELTGEAPTISAQPSGEQANDGKVPTDSDLVTEVAAPSGSKPAVRLPLDRQLLFASIFFGAIVGLIPFWNSPVFVSSMAVLGCSLLFFHHRIYLASLLLTTLVIGIPLVLLLRTRTRDQALFHWGYTMNNPSLWQVLKYLGWSFGLKWLLIAIALIFLSNAQRKLFLAISSLLGVVFLVQLSVDTFNNHKLLNVWAAFAGLYAGYGLWRLARLHWTATALATLLAFGNVLGGIIDLYPIRNDGRLTVPYQNDRLTTWLLENTQPSDVFLSQMLLTHPILFTGHKIFLGNTLFAWSAGYQVGEREVVYRHMFEERDPVVLTGLLRENGIAYVAIDSGVRSNKSIKGLNETVYRQYFPMVFDDTEKKYDFVTIYKVSTKN